jgi:hypothetical protein
VPLYTNYGTDGELDDSGDKDVLFATPKSRETMHATPFNTLLYSSQQLSFYYIVFLHLFHGSEIAHFPRRCLHH